MGLFSSIWFGVFLLFLLFVYSSIGSALPPVRQLSWIEKTEFEWFCWWPFNLLVALLSVNILIVTLRKIPFRITTAGIWMIHFGILILCGGSVYYFSTKLEGDVPVIRRQLVVSLPGAKNKAHLPVLPGQEASIEGDKGVYRLAIADINPEWPMLSGELAGEKAYSVSVMVHPPEGDPFIRQLLAGHPQLTEDILPGQGRAIKVTGQKLVDSNLDLILDYEPQKYFFLQDSAALYARSVGESDWHQRPIADLPHYNDRIADGEQVWFDPHRATQSNPLEIVLPAESDEDPLKDIQVQVQGHLRYAVMEQRWVEGGAELNPVMGIQLNWPGHLDQQFELAAFHPSEGVDQISFHWANTLEEAQQLLEVQEDRLRVQVPAQSIDVEYSLSELLAESSDSAFRQLSGSEYEFRVLNRIPRLPLQDGRVISVVMVEIRTPEKTFTRIVADDPQSTRDMANASDASSGHQMVEPDQKLIMTYTPGQSAKMSVVAGPESVGFYVAWENISGKMERRQPRLGEAVRLGEGVELKLTHFYPRAIPDVRPRIIPIEQREREAGKSFSMIYVTLSKDGWHRSFWLPYHHYVFPSANYRYNIFQYAPWEVRLPDGSTVELIYSREQRPLPAAVALENFTLLTHQGGLIGSNSNVRDYVSELRFAQAGGGWGDPMRMSLNRPAQNQGFWFFQSFWDSPNHDSSGMNFTGLGVGNRNGVYIQLLGTVIAVLGMIFSFYVKPIIMRRRLSNALVRAEMMDVSSEMDFSQGQSRNRSTDHFQLVESATSLRQPENRVNKE